MKKILIILLVLIGFSAQSQELKELYLRERLILRDSAVHAITTGDTLTTKEWVTSNALLTTGNNTEIFFNDNGSLGASSNFKWNDTSALIHDGSNNLFISTNIEENVYSITTGSSNIGIGTSLIGTTTGTQNIGIGTSSNFKNTTGTNNISIGTNTLFNNLTGSSNTTIGVQSLLNSTGSYNTAIGYSAGYSYTGTGSVFLGINAGSNAVGDSLLYIENSNSSSPLIYGEFDNDLVKINGYLDADSSVFELQNISAGLIGATDITLANTWQTVKYDTAYSDVTTDSLIFNSDSTGIESRINGYLQFNGHVSLMNQTAGNITATVYLRLLINDVEVSRFNTAKSRSYAAGGSDDLTSHGGIIKVNKGDIIKVQIRSTSTDININSPDGAIFTNVAPFSILLVEKILNK